jgi:hypothetical protein
MDDDFVSRYPLSHSSQISGCSTGQCSTPCSYCIALGGEPIFDVVGAHVIRGMVTTRHPSAAINLHLFTTSSRVLPHPSYLSTMILILAILAAARASLPSPAGLQSPPLVSLGQLHHVPLPSCDDPNGCRSLTDIIRSCIITIFLCTWVSMHPNIPSPDERWPKVTWRRAGLMLLALLVPEAVIGWALRQRRAAAELAERHKGEP